MMNADHLNLIASLDSETFVQRRIKFFSLRWLELCEKQANLVHADVGNFLFIYLQISFPLSDLRLSLCCYFLIYIFSAQVGLVPGNNL